MPEKIQALNQAARISYLLRDPIELTISHYWHMVRHHTEQRCFFKAIRENHRNLAVSHYVLRLMPYLERFGKDRVAIATLETLARQPIEVVRELYNWLTDHMGDADLTGFAQPETATPEVIRASLWGSMPRRLKRSPWLWNIFAAIPELIQTVLGHFTARNVRRHSSDLANVVVFLRPIQYRSAEELARLPGRNFQEWTTLMNPQPHAPDVRSRTDRHINRVSTMWGQGRSYAYGGSRCRSTFAS